MRVNWNSGVANLPKTSEVALVLLIYLSGFRRPVDPMWAYAALADRFRLGPRERHMPRRTTEQSKWHNRVQTAREHLARLGFVDRTERGWWQLTPQGRAAAARVEGGGP